MKKGLGQMLFNAEGGAINWFPGHMVAATKAIRARLKLADLVIEVRDSRIPISSANIDLQSQIARKRRVIALNKMDLANTRVTPKWVSYFNSLDQDCIPINAYSRVSVQKLLMLVEMKLKELITREPTLLVMVVGVPNVGKSALINSIHQIAAARFPVQDQKKRAVVGPLPGVTQDIAGYKIAHRPSIYVLDTPGVLVPSIPDVETGLKLALTGTNHQNMEFLRYHVSNPGSVKNSVVGEERIARYLFAVLNTRSTPFGWRMEEESSDRSSENAITSLRDMQPGKGKIQSGSNVVYVNDVVANVKCALFETLAEFEGDINDENDLENLIEKQFDVLQKVLKVPYKAYEGRLMVAKKFLVLFRTGKLGQFTFDQAPDVNSSITH